MSESDFRVAIVGGSIAGLTLAHCLHRARIDFIVLEKRDEIASQEGASVGVMPNGGRILEQLGLYGGVEDQIHSLEVAHIGYPDGFYFSSQFPKLLCERFGYPLAFLDRKLLLQHLYSSLPCKDRVYTNKTVARVENDVSHLRVYTQDEECYKCDLVVGADGVHSKVRSEMWRLAGSRSPGLSFGTRRCDMTVEYACVFGISAPNPKLVSGQQITRYNDGWSILGVVGKHGRTYWFLFLKLEKIYQYPNAPRFSSSNAAIQCEKLVQEPFWQDVRFGEVWKRREVFNMVPLEEYAFDRWHFQSIVCIGDSMHKIAPHTGQGANCAIEDAAALTNFLCHYLQTKKAKTTPEELDHILGRFTSCRVDRLAAITSSARLAMRLHARDGFLNRFLGRYILPYTGDMPADKASAGIADGATLDFIPLPERGGHGWTQFGRVSKTPRLRFLVMLLLLFTFVLALVWLMGL